MCGNQQDQQVEDFLTNPIDGMKLTTEKSEESPFHDRPMAQVPSRPQRSTNHGGFWPVPYLQDATLQRAILWLLMFDSEEFLIGWG